MPQESQQAFEKSFPDYPPHFYDLHENGEYIVWDMRNRFMAWQASREQLKAKLLSEEMVEIIKALIDNHYDGDIEALDTHGAAKAALEAVVGQL